MIVLGLTGSIGMGKTLVASFFRQFKIPVYDADAVVRNLLSGHDKVFFSIAEHFPKVIKKGLIDRELLSNEVFCSRESLNLLENILHPIVQEKKFNFLFNSLRQRKRIVVLEVPLLLEKNGSTDCDGIIVVSAPDFVQRSRVLSRPGMTIEKLKFVLDQQLSDEEKRKKADFIIHSGLGKRQSFCSTREIIKIAKSWARYKSKWSSPYKLDLDERYVN